MTAHSSAATRQPVAGEAWLRVEDSIAILHLGAPEEAIVTLTRERIESVERILEQVQGGDIAVDGLVVTGPGPGMFAAGADIGMIQNVSSATEGAEAAARGRAIFQRLRDLPVPVVAAIEGPCLGGGLELALYCDVRVASSRKGTQIGLPEVKLGIVPGFGGTQNLPRLIGLPKALDWILKGKTGTAEQARRAGIVDRVVPHEKLLTAAREEIAKLRRRDIKAPKRRLRGFDRHAGRIGWLRSMVGSKVRKTLAKGAARFYEAPQRALELCLLSCTASPEEGFAKESEVLGELIVSPSCKGLVHLFFLTEGAKRLAKGDGATGLDKALVVGGGVMGAGIGGLMARKGMQVRLCDLDGPVLARAKARMQKGLDKQVRRRRMARHEAMAAQDRLQVGTDWGRLESTDLWLEAVVENMEVKRALFRQAIERGLRENAILATNTSSLSVDAMAEGLPNPERLVGLHFFNPPEKMPLVEVIRGAATSDAVVATACRLSVRLGKFPVVVKNAPGFLVNRCLAPYLNEAAQLMLEGNDPEFIDHVMLDFGMPMGPARLLDEVGWDVAAKVSEVMAAAFPERMPTTPLSAAMVEAGCLGRKAKGGLYRANAPSKKGPGRAVLARLRKDRAVPKNEATRSEITERLIYVMVDEAYRCLQDGIVATEDDLDLGLVMGIGFPPFTGGITRYARREGFATIARALEKLAAGDSRYAPGAGLLALVDR